MARHSVQPPARPTTWPNDHTGHEYGNSSACCHVPCSRSKSWASPCSWCKDEHLRAHSYFSELCGRVLCIVCESRSRSKASAVVECRNASELGIALFMVQAWAQPCSSALLPELSTSAPALKEPSPAWRPTEVRGEQATVCVSSGTFASNPPATLFCGLSLPEHMRLSPWMLTDKCAC